MLIKPENIRAARALLGWSREEFAQLADLNEATIKNFELGKAPPNSETLEKMLNTFKKHHVLIKENGVERADDTITILEGENCYLDLLEDVYQTLKDEPGEELLILNADDRKSSPIAVNMYRKIRSAGIQMRQLVEDNNTYLMGALNEYRYIPKKYFINRVSVIYGDKFAVISRGLQKRITIIKDQEVNESQKNLFEIVWGVSNAPTKSEADERY